MNEASPAAPDGAELLDRIAAFLRRFVVLPEGAPPILATWVVHTHAFAAAEYTPYVVVRSATKRCGKSRLLEVLELLVAKPLASANVTSAALYRVVVEGAEPTLLLDEQDGIRDEDIRKVLNAGFRRGQKVLRTSRDLQGVDELPAFCPKVIASIGAVAPTVADRSVNVRMVRRLPTEPVEPFRRLDVEAQARAIREETRAFAEHHLSRLFNARPSFPDALDDRGRDIYAPLFAIADVAGGAWPAEVRDAAVANRKVKFDERDDPHTELLRDIHDILEGQAGGFVFSNALVFHLVNDQSLRWHEWNRGRGLTPKGLANMLADFGVRPSVRQVGGVQKRGYLVKDLQGPFVRYLSAAEPPRMAEGSDAAPVLREPTGTEPFHKTKRQIEEERKLTG